MAWIGLSDDSGGHFDPAGLRAGKSASEPQASEAVSRGTLVLEYRHIASDVPENILRYSVRDPWAAAFILRAEPKGGLRLLQRQADRTLEYRLSAPLPDPGETVRLTYHWDAPAREARLSLDLASSDRIVTGRFLRPFPLFSGDLARLIAGRGVKWHPERAFAAIADHTAPFGPVGGIGAQTPVMTPGGPRLAKALRTGDEVVTGAGTVAKVLHSGLTEMPARGRLAPVLLRAPHYGLTEDILASASQPILLEGSEVEYLFGTPRVTAAAGDLIDGVSVLPVPDLATVRYVHLLLDRPGTLRIGGLQAEPLGHEALRGLAGPHLLADLPGALWPAPAPAEEPPRLRRFEAESFCRMRAA